jgi:hypothetical protein
MGSVKKRNQSHSFDITVYLYYQFPEGFAIVTEIKKAGKCPLFFRTADQFRE